MSRFCPGLGGLRRAHTAVLAGAVLAATWVPSDSVGRLAAAHVRKTQTEASIDLRHLRSSQTDLQSTYLAAAARIKVQLYEAPRRHIRVVTTNGPPVDLMLHHGGAYRVRERARIEGRLQDGAVLVLLDSHADLTDQVGVVPRPSTVEETDWIEYDIASHVVPSLADGLVGEVIHVANRGLAQQGRLPAHVPGVRQVWVTEFRDSTGVETAVLLDGPRPDHRDALARVRPLLKRRNRFVDDLEFLRTGTTPVTVRTIFPEDLPDFSGDRRTTLLDIDADFFTLGPSYDPVTDKERAEIEHAAHKTLASLWQHGMRPGSINVALSPGYTPEDRMAIVTAALLASLEQAGFVQFERRADGTLRVEVHERTADTLPEVRTARAAVAAAEQDPRRIADALNACQVAISVHSETAANQQRRGWAKSPFVGAGNPGWTWQPSPVMVAQRELNGVAEAHALRASLLMRQGRHAETLRDLLALRDLYPDAYQPVSVRQYKDGFGWTVGQGWQPRQSTEADALLLQVTARLLVAGRTLEEQPFYLAWPFRMQRDAKLFLADLTQFGQPEATARLSRRMAGESGDVETITNRILVWVGTALADARRVFHNAIDMALGPEPRGNSAPRGAASQH